MNKWTNSLDKNFLRNNLCAKHNSNTKKIDTFKSFGSVGLRNRVEQELFCFEKGDKKLKDVWTMPDGNSGFIL